MPLNSAFATDPTVIRSDKTFVTDTNSTTITLTISNVPIGTQTDRLLVVSVGLDQQTAPVPTVSSITFGPTGTSCTVNQSFTQVPSSTSTVATKIRNELWYLTAPSASQTCNVIVTLTNNVGASNGHDAIVVSVLFSGVDQTTPIDNTVTATGTDDAPKVTIPDTDGHIILDVMSSTSDGTPTQGSNQASQGGITNSFNFLSATSTSLFAHNGDPDMNWSFTTSAPPTNWAISAIAILSSPTLSVAQNSNGGGCSGDCTPPTLGLDSTDRRIISNGFSYNGKSVNVESYYTPFPLVLVNVGEENKAVLQIYDNSGPQHIKHVGLGFGLAKGESFNNARAVINLDIVNGEETVTTFDPENVFENIRVITEEAKCTDIESQCLFVSIFHTFREPLNFNIVSTNIWDDNRNAWQNYFNHGIQIEGNSLNPPKTKMVAFGETQMRGLYKLTQISKIDDLWSDEIGNTYHYVGNDRFDRISLHSDYDTLNLETKHGCDRNCYLFSNYKTEQQDIAQEKLDKLLQGKLIQNPTKGFYTIKSNSLSRSEDVELQNRISNEIIRAQDTYEKLFASLEKDRVKD
jgi:hypothetical protein